MSLYVCEECGSVENTALSNYHARNVEGDGRALCSACDPDIGEWHGRFPQEPWNGETQVRNPPVGDTCKRCGNGPYEGGECSLCGWNPETQDYPRSRAR